MANFNPASLSADDQQAYQTWQQQVATYLAQNKGAMPAEASYAMVHPEYLSSHPELTETVKLLTGAALPQSIRQQLGDQHLDWSDPTRPTWQQNKGLWSNPETWIQLGLGGAMGAAVIPAILGSSAAAGGAGAASAGAGAGTAAGAGGAAGTAAAAGGGILSTAGKIANLAKDVGGVTSALAGGAANARLDQTNINQRQDALALKRYEDEQAAARLNLTAPATRAATSVRGDILANAQPFKWTGSTQMVGNIPVPQSTGGLSPAIFSANTRALGGQLSSQALADNTAMGGKAVGDAPGLTPTPSPTMGNILGTAGIIGGGVQTFADAFNRYKKNPNQTTTTDAGDQWLT